jgi:hypothetical protein
VPSQEAMQAALYLKGEHLLETSVGPRFHLLHRGVVEIEAAILHPENATEHFTQQVVQIVNNFHAPVGAVQVGASTVANVVQPGGVEPPPGGASDEQ